MWFSSYFPIITVKPGMELVGRQSACNSHNKLKCCIHLVTPWLNMIKQHATMCSKCFMTLYEMLYSFGQGSKSKERWLGVTMESQTFWQAFFCVM